jgi:hypothetical protein
MVGALLLHPVSRLGYDIIVDPTIPGGTGRPDLLITKRGSKMYVECVVLFDDGSTRTTDNEAWLKDCIDAARNPDFMVSIRFKGVGTQRPRKRVVTREIEDWLASLDYDSVRAQFDGVPLPLQTFDFGGSRVELTALPVNPDSRGLDLGRIGIGPGSAAFVVQSVDAIRKLVGKKALQCDGVDAPLIVAVLNWSTLATPRGVEEATFGSTATRYRLHDSASVKKVRETDGYWHPGPPPRGGRVSAVMFSEHLHASRVAAELPTLWLNPWAHKPIADRLPFEMHTAHDTGEVFQAAEVSTSPEVVFGLPPKWPVSSSGMGKVLASGPP